MSGFAASFPDDVLIAALGDDILYVHQNGSSTSLKAVVDKDTSRVGSDGFTLELRTEVELLIADLEQYPKKGDQILDGKQTYLVDSIIYNDGAYVRMTVK